MARFDVHKWRSEQYQKDYLENQILEQLIRETLNIPKNQPLNEGKFGDFFKVLKDKIKNSKAFGSIIAMAGKAKDASKAVAFGFRLKSLGILPKNEEQAQILKDTLEGNKTNLKEVTEKEYQQTVNKAIKEDEKLFNWWNDTWVGVSLRNFFIFATIFNITASDIATTASIINPDLDIKTQVGITHDNAGAIDVMLDDAGFDDPNQRADIMAGTGDVTIKNAYSHGGDIKIAIDNDGGVDVEGGDDTDLGALATDSDLVSDFEQQGGKISVEDNQTVNFNLFDLGSSNLTDSGKQELQNQNDAVINFLLNGQSYSETITGHASNTGANSMFDNGTGEADKLPTNRATNTGEFILNDLKAELDSEGVKYSSTGNSITLEDGTTYTQNIDDNSGFDAESQLQQIDPTDETASQSATRTGHAEEVPPDSGFTFIDYDPVAVVPKGPEVPPPAVTPAPIPSPETLTGNRQAQITAIFQYIVPETVSELWVCINKIKGLDPENKMVQGAVYPYSDWENVYREGSGDSNRDWSKASDEELEAIGASRYEKGGEKILVPPEGGWPQGSECSDDVKSLARVIVNARKSPDTWTTKIGNILGIEFGKRSKSVSMQPGAAGQAMDLVGLEESHPLYELLNEAAIDQFLDRGNIEKNAGKILSFIGSMYASEDNITLGILNPKDLSPELLKQLEGEGGFAPSTTGREGGVYLFTGTGDKAHGETGLHLGGTPTGFSDDDVKKSKGNIYTTPKGVDEFPDDFKDSDFVKKAKEKGWIFVDRKDLDYLPKGTKVKPFTSKKGKNNSNYWDSWIKYFNRKLFDEPFLKSFDDKKNK